ncbi:hypothetical protein ACFPRL_36640 [Pseudoclavibacter helvolus]
MLRSSTAARRRHPRHVRWAGRRRPSRLSSAAEWNAEGAGMA